MDIKSYKFFLCTLALCVSVPAFAGVYSWTDADGTVHYGDQVPPEDSQAGHRQINEQGQVVRSIPPRKSEAQLAAERLERERLAHEAQVMRDQKIRDTTLMSTFSSVQEMDRIRDDRLQTLDSLISLGRDKVASWNVKLKEAETQKAAYEARGAAVPQQLQKNIEVIRSQMSYSETKIAEFHQKKLETKEKFGRDRARFLELQAKKN